MVAVLFVDLDRFKLVNDGLGHETGDELLVAVGRRLGNTVRRQDTVARFGGDEFVVLCEDLGSEEQAIELAERAAAAFVDPFVLSRGRGDGVGEHRDRGDQPLGGAGVEPAAGRRRRDVPRQASRWRPPRAVRRGHAHPGRFPAAHRAGAATRAGARRAARAVPAAVRPRERPARRGGSTAPLGSSGARPRAAGRLPARRRGDRHHRAHRRVGARPGLRAPAHHEDRRPGRGPAQRVDQRVGPAAATSRLPRARRPRRARLRGSIRPHCRWRSPRARCSTISTPPARRCGRSRTSACTSPSTTSAPVDRR